MCVQPCGEPCIVQYNPVVNHVLYSTIPVVNHVLYSTIPVVNHVLYSTIPVHAHSTHPLYATIPMVALLMFMCIVSILCVIMRVPVLVQYMIRMVSASTISPVHHMQCGVYMAPCEGESLPVLPRPSL